MSVIAFNETSFLSIIALVTTVGMLKATSVEVAGKEKNRCPLASP
jgi:hypothetical protein